MSRDVTPSERGTVTEEELFALGYTLHVISELVVFVDTKQLTNEFSRTLDQRAIETFPGNTHFDPEFTDKIGSRDFLLHYPLRI